MHDHASALVRTQTRRSPLNIMCGLGGSDRPATERWPTADWASLAEAAEAENVEVK